MHQVSLKGILHSVAVHLFSYHQVLQRILQPVRYNVQIGFNIRIWRSLFAAMYVLIWWQIEPAPSASPAIVLDFFPEVEPRRVHWFV
jgi:hypothetical protein